MQTGSNLNHGKFLSRKLAFLPILGAAVLAACDNPSKVDGTNSSAAPRPNAIDPLSFLRPSKWPLGYHQQLADIERMTMDGKWDEAISAYESMLNEPKVAAMPDFRAHLYLVLGETHLWRSKGDDINRYLLCFCLALNQEQSSAHRAELLEHLSAVARGLRADNVAQIIPIEMENAEQVVEPDAGHAPE